MLFEKYTHLCDSRLPDGEQLLATPLDAWTGVWLAVDRKSQPALLFANDDQTELNDLKLQLVDVVFSKHSQITESSGKTTDGVFTVVRLNDNDPDLAHVFLRLLEVAFLELRSDFSNRSIRQEIVRLADLFQRAESDLNDIVGLWGELYVIKTSSHTESAVRSWCSHPKAKFDFVSSGHSVEVKSTLKARRVHRFSLDQVRPTSSHPHFVASLLLLEKPDGQTVGSLVDALNDQILGKELKSVFLKQCLMKAGLNLYNSETKIGVLPGGESLAMYSSPEIPAPLLSDCDSISNVRFDVDLTDIEALAPNLAHDVLRFEA